MFQIGDYIKFKYTGLEAEILENHKDGSYTVWLIDENDESIAFEEDIVLSKDFTGVQKSEQQLEFPQKETSKNKAPSTEDLFFSKAEQKARQLQALQPSNNKYIRSKKKEDTIKPSTLFVPKQLLNNPPQGLGCYLAFHQTSTDQYTIHLVNDTPTSFSFQFSLYLNQQLEHRLDKMIPANTYFPIGEFSQTQFNDSPQIEFNCPSIHFHKRFKLKYKKFLVTNGAVPLLGIETYHFFLFSTIKRASKTTTSIKEYTTQQWLPSTKHKLLYQKADLMDIASFERELDLHAEKLVNDTSKYTAGELLTIQLQAVENFINQALVLELEEVFLIHGVGKGKLREEIEQYLYYHNDIKKYKNEFHEKYGYGATRVVLKC